MDGAEIDRRFSSHVVEDDQGEQMGTIRDKARELAYLITRSSEPGREQSLAMTALEEAVFWANAAISRPPSRPER